MLLAIFAVTLATSTATARVDAVAVPVSAKAVRASGELSDEVWQTATPVDVFVQREPEEGGKSSQRTEFRVAYDASTLFVKVRAFDTDPDRIVSYLTRRDGDSPSDWIRVLIDSYHDKRTAYEFAVNPAGVKQDRYWFNDNNSDDSWDAVWDVKVSRDPAGWTAEFRIPFSQLRFNPSETITFGFAVSRQIGRLNETSTWPLLARSATGYVSSFGELSGLAMGRSPKRLEVVPYTVADLTRQRPEGNPLLKASAPGLALGMDLKYALTPGLTFTSTINPDFGHVPLRFRLLGWPVLAVLHTARRPRAAGHGQSAERRRHLHRLSRAVDDSRRGETDGARREVLRRRDARGDAGGDRYRARRHRALSAGGRADDQLLGGARATGVRQPVVDRVHADGHQPATARHAAVSAEQRLRRRRRFRRALQVALQPHRLLGGEPRERQRRRHRLDSGEQPTLFPATGRYLVRAESDAHVAQRDERTGRDQQDRWPAPAFRLAGRLQVARIRPQRRRVPSPGGRALAAQLVSDPPRRAEPLVSQP